jgi:hypothetical protein
MRPHTSTVGEQLQLFYPERSLGQHLTLRVDAPKWLKEMLGPHARVGRSIRIDEDIAPLIGILWSQRVATVFCCQGIAGWRPAYIDMLPPCGARLAMLAGRHGIPAKVRPVDLWFGRVHAERVEFATNDIGGLLTIAQKIAD